MLMWTSLVNVYGPQGINSKQDIRFISRQGHIINISATVAMILPRALYGEKSLKDLMFFRAADNADMSYR